MRFPSVETSGQPGRFRKTAHARRIRSNRRRFAVGCTRDDPDDADLPDGGRTENEVLYLHNRLRRLGENIDFGLNSLDWTTHYRGQSTGRDNRLNVFLQRNF